jgi:HSP20 family molecular chaperone IbpA
MAEAPSSPKDVADMLDALARRIRADPGFKLNLPPPRGMQVVPAASNVEIREDGEGPQVGAVDVFRDERAVTVTVETRNADAASVHVSLADGRLLINLGEGPNAMRRDLDLPAAVDEDAAFATFRNGILDVVLPLRGTVKGR